MNKLLKHINVYLLSAAPSFLRAYIYRKYGWNVGRRVKFGMFSFITAEEVSIGDDCTFSAFSRIHGSKCVIGNRFTLGKFSKIAATCVIIGDDCVFGDKTLSGGRMCENSLLKMANRSSFGERCYIDTNHNVIIGHDSHVGMWSYLFTHACGHSASYLDGYPRKIAPIVIGHNTWCMAHTFIMPGVTIGNGVIVNPGSVISNNIADLSLVQGSPARVVSKSGSHLIQLSEVEEMEILKNIFVQFVERLRFRGLDILFEISYNEQCFSVIVGGTNILHFTNVDTTLVAPSLCMVYLKDIAPARLRDVAAQGSSWIDMKRRRYFAKSSEIISEFRLFLEEYGVIIEAISIDELSDDYRDSESIRDLRSLIWQAKLSQVAEI